jgi:hypothetical protein
VELRRRRPAGCIAGRRAPVPGGAAGAGGCGGEADGEDDAQRPVVRSGGGRGHRRRGGTRIFRPTACVLRRE